MLARVSERLKKGQTVRIVCYGDSISEVYRTPDWYGGASCPEKNWGQQLWQLLIERYPARKISLDHFGIGGQNAYEGYGRMDLLRPFRPDLALVEFGANDCGWHYLPPEATATALKGIVQGVRALYAADVVLLGTGGDNPLASKFEHLDETLAAQRRVAEETGAPFVDIRGAVLKGTRNGELWEQFHRGKQDCHPNDAGMTVWAQAVFEVLTANIVL